MTRRTWRSTTWSCISGSRSATARSWFGCCPSPWPRQSFRWSTESRLALFSGRHAMFATALLVVSPTFVAVSQEARSYALTLFLVCARIVPLRAWDPAVIARRRDRIRRRRRLVGLLPLLRRPRARGAPVLCPVHSRGHRPSVRRLAAVYCSIAVITIPALRSLSGRAARLRPGSHGRARWPFRARSRGSPAGRKRSW